MFAFAITPENRIAVEIILLVVCSAAAIFIAPAKQTATVSVKRAVPTQQH